MSGNEDIGNPGGTEDEPDLGATEEMPVAAAPRSSSRRVPASAGARAARPAEPVQLASGQSSGESQAAYAAGPKAIPPSRNGLGSDPAPAVIVDGAQAHVLEPDIMTPPPPSGGGLYLAPVPAFPSSREAPPPPSLRPPGPLAPPPTPTPSPAYAAAHFVAPLPPPRRKIRSETVVISVPRRFGPSPKDKALAFMVVMIVVVLLGVIIVLLFSRARAAAVAEPQTVAPEPTALPVVPVVPVAATVEPTAVAPPPIAVVGAAPPVVDAGAKKRKKH